jgi:hypothetical protein
MSESANLSSSSKGVVFKPPSNSSINVPSKSAYMKKRIISNINDS